MGFSLLTTIATRAVSFLNRRNADQLWKAMTTVRPGGRKKGRMKALRRPKDLNKGQVFGIGKINVKWPGLSAPVVTNREITRQQYLEPDSNLEEKIFSLRKTRRFGKRITSVHPLLRGYSGTSWPGRPIDNPKMDENDRSLDGFKTYVIRLDTLQVMRSLGRTRFFLSLLATGNGDGLIGYSLGKSKAPMDSIKLAARDLPKRLVYVPRLDGKRIFQDFMAQCYGVRLEVHQMPEGFGLECHPLLKILCKLAGLDNLAIKVDGNTKNYLGITRAFFNGLVSQESHQQLVDREQLHLVEMRPETGYLPKIVASPTNGIVRESTDPFEVLELGEYYAKGRYPYHKPTYPKRYFQTRNVPAIVRREWLDHPFRNMEKVEMRLLGKWELEDLREISLRRKVKQEHEEVMTGQKPMPVGIGLPSILRENLIEETEKKKD